MEVTKKEFCEWCNREGEIEKMINTSNMEDFPLWYHESCLERAKDKLGE